MRSDKIKQANWIDYSVDATQRKAERSRVVRKLLTDHWLLKANTLTMYCEAYNIWRSIKCMTIAQRMEK